MADIISILNTLRSGEPVFRTLGYLRIDSDTIRVGGCSVVARCCREGYSGSFALKCYYRMVTNSAVEYSEYYYPRELEVLGIDGTLDYVDVALLPWIEGETLDSLIKSPDVDYRSLLVEIDRLSARLYANGYEHGDIKPENIIVTNDGTMHLIDWDESHKVSQRQNTSNKRAMATILSMLAAMASKGAYNSNSKRAGLPSRRWERIDEERLVLMCNDGISIENMALALRRTPQAVRSRLSKLGVSKKRSYRRRRRVLNR